MSEAWSVVSQRPNLPLQWRRAPARRSFFVGNLESVLLPKQKKPRRGMSGVSEQAIWGLVEL
jgi:hypothetical protein